MERNPLLDTYLRQLRLPTFLKLYAQFATDAARNNEDARAFSAGSGRTGSEPTTTQHAATAPEDGPFSGDQRTG